MGWLGRGESVFGEEIVIILIVGVGVCATGIAFVVCEAKEVWVYTNSCWLSFVHFFVLEG